MVEKLLIRLIGDGSSYRAMLSNASRQTQRMEKSVEGLSRKLGSIAASVRRMGTALTVGVTLPLIGMQTAAVAAFAKFDKAMVESTSIMKVTTKQTREMRNVALELSGKSIQGPTELARSYFFLASAGLDAEQSMAALPQVTKFATAGAFDMATATDLLTDAQSALGLTSKDAQENLKGMARVSDVLVKANTLANASVQQFSEALTNTAGATLKNFNKSVEEGVAVLAAYADQGVKAQVAGTNLTRVTLLLQQAVLKNSSAHKRLGFRVFDSSGKMRNYADIIANLEKITEGMTDRQKSATLAQLGFTARVQNAILPLIGASQKIREYEKDLRQAGGTTENVAGKQMKAFSNQLTMMRNKLTGVATKLGETLAPDMEKVNSLLDESIDFWEDLNKETKVAALAILGVSAALGPALLTFGLALSSMKSLVSLGLVPLKLAFKALLIPMAVPLAMLSGLPGAALAAVGSIGLLVLGVRLLTGSWEETGRVLVDVMKAHQDLTRTLGKTLLRSTVTIVSRVAGEFNKLTKKLGIKDFFEGVMGRPKDLARLGTQIGTAITNPTAVLASDPIEVWSNIFSKKNMMRGIKFFAGIGKVSKGAADSASEAWKSYAEQFEKDVSQEAVDNDLFKTLQGIGTEELGEFSRRNADLIGFIKQTAGRADTFGTNLKADMDSLMRDLGIKTGISIVPQIDPTGVRPPGGATPISSSLQANLLAGASTAMGRISTPTIQPLSQMEAVAIEDPKSMIDTRTAVEKMKQDTGKMVDLLEGLLEAQGISIELSPLGGGP